MEPKNKKTDFKAKLRSFKVRELMKKYSVSVYMSLALMLAAVAAVSIFSLSYSNTDLPPLSVDIPDVSLPDVFIPEPSSKDDTPVDSNQSGIEEPVVTVKEYFYPVNGEAVKGYSSDTLVFSETLKDYRVHNGVDFAAEKGSAVVSYADGVVSQIYNDPLMGTVVCIEHEFDLVSYYMGVDSQLPENVKVGLSVKGGDVIAAVGNSSLLEVGEPSHLHFEMKVGGKSIDPEKELADCIKK